MCLCALYTVQINSVMVMPAGWRRGPTYNTCLPSKSGKRWSIGWGGGTQASKVFGLQVQPQGFGKAIHWYGQRDWLGSSTTVLRDSLSSCGGKCHPRESTGSAGLQAGHERSVTHNLALSPPSPVCQLILQWLMLTQHSSSKSFEALYILALTVCQGEDIWGMVLHDEAIFSCGLCPFVDKGKCFCSFI